MPRSSVSELLDSLNPEQRVAAEHFEGPSLVLAGAGSGKTRVLTTRIAHLVQEHGVPPERILAVTFTNKAAGEMRERIGGLLGGEPRGMWVGTFHALGVRILRRHAPRLGWERTFTIFDAEQSLRQVKRTLESLDFDPKRFNPKGVRSMMSGAKNQLVTPGQFQQEHGEGFDLFARAVAKVYPAYQTALKDQNAMDFDDLLVKPVELLQNDQTVLDEYRRRFAFLLVDEYQDTNHAQFRFLQLLAAEHGNLMVVGDDDQSIYGWRGADLRNILDFESTWPGSMVVRLERNYRSTAVILEAANQVIAENVNRKGKTLRTDREGGEKIGVVECFDENDEARVVVDEIKARYQNGPALHNYRDFAVLYRTNAQSRALEDAFRRSGVPYQIVGGVRFYERREIQDVMGYLRLVSNPLDEDAFLRVVNYPRRGIGNTTVARLREAAAAEGAGLLEAASRATTLPNVPTGGARQLEAFAELVSTWSARAATTRVGPLLEALVDELGLYKALEDEGPEGEDRIDNVKELIAGALDFNAELLDELDPEEIDAFSELDLFLQRVALVADVDRLDGDVDSVTMMTLHNAKGLEFPVVFITGLEDGLFPLSRAYDEPATMEEERRLFYVGVTRARDTLILCHARQRRRAGEYMYGRLSPFAESIPEALLVPRVSPRLESNHRRSSTPHRSRPRFEAEKAGSGFVSEETFDTPINQDAPRYVKGERVLHATFGSGTVKEVTGFGKDTKVTVDFDDVGRKRLLVRYANLEKDWTM
ncbi:UvrD-helicase domain-containing protein [Gaopeijia maritima]|uniref:ATP-dependent helicase n=1 Tax=Gaopeijia maritima TaxID=3119007 RepID=UPI003255156D